MNEVKCVLCNKTIGKRVVEGSTDFGGWIGKVECSRQKLDYRKSSHIYFDGQNDNGKRVHGSICKTCAKSKFPEGKAYTVKFLYHGKETSIFGVYGSYFPTRKEAEQKCDEMTQKRVKALLLELKNK